MQHNRPTLGHMTTQVWTKKPNEPGSARAEAAGLRWLREGSDAAVEVFDVDDSQLVIERVASVRPTREAAAQAGRELARIHAAGADKYGTPPPGWGGPFYFGVQQQTCDPVDDWADFYANQRVRPYLRRALKIGTMSGDDVDVVEKALELLDRVPCDGPVRTHGDLWAGNLMFDSSGPRFIDPAACGGHREADLAMLALFGAPHLDAIRAGYQEIHSLPDGWMDFTCVHQLHPLAAHAVTHGPLYGQETVQAARAAISILS